MLIYSFEESSCLAFYYCQWLHRLLSSVEWLKNA